MTEVVSPSRDPRICSMRSAGYPISHRNCRSPFLPSLPSATRASVSRARGPSSRGYPVSIRSRAAPRSRRSAMARRPTPAGAPPTPRPSSLTQSTRSPSSARPSTATEDAAACRAALRTASTTIRYAATSTRESMPSGSCSRMLMDQPPCRVSLGANLGGGDAGRLQGRRDHDHLRTVGREHLVRRCQGGGLSRAGCPLDDEQSRVARKHPGHIQLGGVELGEVGSAVRRLSHRALAPLDELRTDRVLDIHHPLRGQGAHVFRRVVPLEQVDAYGESPGGEVLGELTANGTGRDDVYAGDDAFDLAADVGGVPARAFRAEAREGELDDGVTVEVRDRRWSEGWGRSGGRSRGRPVLGSSGG